MKLPKKVRINNIPFSVVKNKDNFGSSFSYKSGIMSIGSRGKDCEVLEGFLHEVAEVSMVERGMRSAKCKPTGTENEYVFCGSHKDFRDVITDISIVVSDLMKLE